MLRYIWSPFCGGTVFGIGEQTQMLPLRLTTYQRMCKLMVGETYMCSRSYRG